MNRPIPAFTIESLLSTSRHSSDFEIFRFEYFAEDIEHLKAPHRHTFYTLLFITHGGGSHSIDFKNYELKPGRLFLIAPQQVHAWEKLEDVKGYVLLFTNTFMALSKHGKVMSSWPLFRVHQPNYLDIGTNDGKLFESLFENIMNENLTHDEFTNEALVSRINTLLIKICRLMGAHSVKTNIPTQDLLFIFQELIEENFLQLRSPKDYAGKMFITPNYLNALCKKKAGKSAGEIIRQRIILEAKRLLAHSTLSVSEIAFKLNFQDNSYFGRFFKNASGLTPDAFRKQFTTS